jgi:hypothetical protein
VRSWILFFALVTPLAACVSVPPAASLSQQSAVALAGKSMALTSRPPFDFVPTTAGKAGFGMIGAFAMIEAGKKLVAENGIEDPGPPLAQALRAAAVAKYGVVPATAAPVAVNTDEVAKLVQAARGSDLLLDVQVLGTGYRYLPLNWSHYVVDSSYVLRLLSVADGKVLGSGRCVQSTPDDHDLPTQDELLADKAARLKSVLAMQRESCLQQFKQQVFGMTG